MSWWQQRMCALDLETTSADPEEARIVSATVAMVGGDAPVSDYSWLCDPGVEIPAEATEVHGITTERARAEGAELVKVLPAIASLLRIARDEGWAAVAFNTRYDCTVLDRELRRHDLAPLAEVITQLCWVDPMVIDRELDKYRAGKRRLLEMCEVYRVRLEGAHDAAFDAIAAARLAYRIGKDARVIRRCRGDAERREFIELSQWWEAIRNDLPALHEWQRKLAYQGAVELEEYFHRGNPSKGVPPQPERVVPREWPLIPFGMVREPVPAPEWAHPLQSEAQLTMPEWTR